jgi:NAD(P)H-hydrate epimerase
MQADIVFTGLDSVNENFRDITAKADFIVDALFGIGLDRELATPYADYIVAMNASGRPIVAVDCPSGLQCDTGAVMGVCIRADHTVTMIAPKKGFYLEQGPEYTGSVHCVDISIPHTLVSRYE